MRKKNLRKWVSVLCALTLSLQLFQGGGVRAMALQPEGSRNEGSEEYDRWARPVESYLYVREDGCVTRVEYRHDYVIAEDYDEQFQIISRREIPNELPIWGGFYAGTNANFLIWGQKNKEQDDTKEVIRVVKYSRDWERQGSASLYGANTTVPFDAGSLRCDEAGKYLYVRTSHEMYRSDDGVNHQANLTFSVDTETMTITDSMFGVSNTGTGYVSHSFNQFILANQEGHLVAADHGDAYPRGIVLIEYPHDASTGKVTGYGCRDTMIQEFPGEIGDNATGASIGGLAETQNGYVVAYAYDGMAGSTWDTAKQPYFAYVDKVTRTPVIHSFANREDLATATTPVLASKGPDGGYMMWRERRRDFYWHNYYPGLKYIEYDSQGNISEVKTADASLSDCQPVPYKDGVIWYVTLDEYNEMPVFFTLDSTGAHSYPGTGRPGPLRITAEGDRVSVWCAEQAPAAGRTWNCVLAAYDRDGRLLGSAVQELTETSVGSEGCVAVFSTADWLGADTLRAFLLNADSGEPLTELAQLRAVS